VIRSKIVRSTAAIVLATCAVIGACSAFGAGGDEDPGADAGDGSADVTIGDAAPDADGPRQGIVFRDGFDSTCANWMPLLATAIRADTDAGSACRFCLTQAGTSHMERAIPSPGRGTYDLRAKIQGDSTWWYLQLGRLDGGFKTIGENSGMPQSSWQLAQTSANDDVGSTPLVLRILIETGDPASCILVDDVEVEWIPPP
jgi:hypothetical protein